MSASPDTTDSLMLSNFKRPSPYVNNTRCTNSKAKGSWNTNVYGQTNIPCSFVVSAKLFCESYSSLVGGCSSPPIE